MAENDDHELLREYERTKRAELETRRAEMHAREQRAKTRFRSWAVTVMVGAATTVILIATPIRCSVDREVEKRRVIEVRYRQCQHQLDVVRSVIGNAVTSSLEMEQ